MSSDRGYWWEATFTGSPGEIPSQPLDLREIRDKEDAPKLGHSKNYNKYVIQSAKGPFKKLVGYAFETCDFINKTEYEIVNFENCHFKNCRFDGNCVFISVKFSGCTFEKCHFGYSTFRDCRFLHCKFSNNTANEFMILERTSIHASEFLAGLTINEEHIEADQRAKRIEYQWYRHRKNLAKIAQKILISTNAESDQDVYFDAHKATTLRWIHWKAARAKYVDDGRIEGNEKTWKEPERRRFWYPIMLSVNTLDYAITFVSGLFTDWGRSIARPALFFLVMVVLFSGLYSCHLNDWCMKQESERVSRTSATDQVSENPAPHSCPTVTNPLCAEYSYGDALLRAIDVSVVAGYTKYWLQSDGNSPDSHSKTLRYITCLNLLLGLYWYALMIPVILKRIIRS